MKLTRLTRNTYKKEKKSTFCSHLILALYYSQFPKLTLTLDQIIIMLYIFIHIFIHKKYKIWHYGSLFYSKCKFNIPVGDLLGFRYKAAVNS